MNIITKVIFLVVLLGAVASPMVTAQAFNPPAFKPPFPVEGKPYTGGQIAFGEAAAGRRMLENEPGSLAAQSACSMDNLQVNKKQSCDSSLGNVTLNRGATNLAPIIVIIKK